jgi:hypothetical protein
MSESLDLTSSGILIGDGSGRARDLSSIFQPSENQIFILDSDFKSADQKFIVRIPISFQIDYKNRKITNPPELFLLINPSNLNFSSSKKINSEFARGGYITEEWGDLQEILEFSGKIGGYYVLNPKVGFSGLNRHDRTKSPSFRNLMNLLMIYRNNGMIYDNTPPSSQKNKSDSLMKNTKVLKQNVRSSKMAVSKKNRIIGVGDVYLNYDGVSYRGSFDSFSIEEKADEPYTLSYSFSFTVRDKYEVDKRGLDNFLNNGLDIKDRDIGKPSTKETKDLERAIASSLNSSQESLSDQRSNLASQNQSLLNPTHSSPLEEILKGRVVNLTVDDHTKFLSSKGLQLQNDDVINLTKNVEGMNSSNFTESNSSFNDSKNTHLDILGKNGFPSNSETSGIAENYSQELKRNLDEKNKLAKD